ncbi:MAG: DUF86 domain-containing protein [Anaerolineae bacterium]|nr:DUF86 domain-containing protein [Anaerolineae bacterium]
MPRSIKEYLEDILRATETIIARTNDQTETEFFADDVLVDAVLFNLVAIGEACNHLPENLRAQHADIEWAVIIAMRNRIVHGYWDVNPTIIWETLQQNIPPLRDRIQSLLEDFQDED